MNSRHPETPAHEGRFRTATPDTRSGECAGSGEAAGSADEFLTPNSVRSYPPKVGSGEPISGKNNFWTLPGLKAQHNEEIMFLYNQNANQVFPTTSIFECKIQRKSQILRKTLNDPRSITVILH